MAADDPRPCYYIFHIERDDLEEPPFGQRKMHQLFGADMDGLIDELNQALAARTGLY